jgi:uncharacterized protein YjbI with pentapeptide repeats
MIYWLQEATTAGSQGGGSSWLLSAGIIGATVSLIGLILAQLRHTQTLRQTRELEDTRRLEARELENQRAHEAALQKYFEQMRDSLADPKRPLRRSTKGDSLSTIARAQTLAVLEGLDANRKRILLQFLYEASLIKRLYTVIDLLGANLRGGHLEEADLRLADLSGADLSDAHLRDANLLRADLAGADLAGANLSDAHLRDANLRGADLKEAKNLTQEQVDSAYGDKHTKLPEDLQRPAHWSKGDEEESEES